MVIAKVQLEWVKRSTLRTKQDVAWKQNRFESNKVNSIIRTEKDKVKRQSIIITKKRRLKPIISSNFLDIPSKLKRNVRNLDC